MAAAFVDSPVRELLWIAAAVIDFCGPLLFGIGGWRIAPSYFVERHGLVVIIALGEAIVEVGAGAEENLARPKVLGAVVLAVLIAAGLWWSYFGYIRSGAESRLRGAEGQDRARLARDSYSYLHLPLVAGIVFFALGVHEAVAGVDEPLSPLSALALAPPPKVAGPAGPPPTAPGNSAPWPGPSRSTVSPAHRAATPACSPPPPPTSSYPAPAWAPTRKPTAS